ncbi:E3 ubiquitin-protein ligase hel2 [Diplonema papillatum]|nr:E3 ubiquitin-protein ligase hel2 [Diplonema papillatum]KAJ9455917.1 E3 ubiquitin-protein ligase hel2 [Diplonema papillatum]KAJ9455918.1 E3 ubiquitin-protein ligase hel2 [Diplonema papillatum]KAJ9455919.1 E3 ubiquitin-protein ligase hel2 [Diplonema papillatum]
MDTCIFCAEETKIWGKLDCGHHNACWKCVLKLRYKTSDESKAKLCQQCQQPSDGVYLFEDDADQDNAEAPVVDRIWQDVVCESEKIRENVSYLRDLFCPKWEQCKTYDAFRSMVDLKQHLDREHGLQFCGICLAHRPLFLSEQTLFTKAQFKKHESTDQRADSDPSNFYGHPPCYFCSGARMYDTEALYNHMHQKHFLCDICERSADGKKMVFYKDTRELVLHWRDSHIYCERCHEEKADNPSYHPSEWVFASALDLAAHNSSVHGTGGGRRGKSTNVQLELGFGSMSYAEEVNLRRHGGRSTATSSSEAYAEDAKQASVITFHMGHRRSETVPLGIPGTAPAGVEGGSGHSGKGRGRGKGGKGGADNGEQEGYSPHSRGRGRGGQHQRESSHGHAERENGRADFAAFEDNMSNKERNLRLMAKMKKLLGHSLPKFNQLRVVSSEFLKGKLQAADYYEQLVLYFGGNLDQVFSDLVELLPDPNKRTGLRLVHSSLTSSERGVPDVKVASTSRTLQSTRDQKKEQQQQQQQQQNGSHGATASSGNPSWRATVAGNSHSRSPPPVADPNAYPALPSSSKKSTRGVKPVAKSAPSGVWAQKVSASKKI